MPDTLDQDTLYVKLKRPAERLVPLGLTLDPEATEIVARGVVATWTYQALELLSQIRQEVANARDVRAISLPYASLRSLLELELPASSRIRRSLGLSLRELGRRRKPTVFLHVDEGAAVEATRAALGEAVSIWTLEDLVGWASRAAGAAALVERFHQVVAAGEAVKFEPSEATVVPWGRHPTTGTTAAPHWSSFRALADWAARQLAGHELLPGTGSWRRVVCRSGDDAEAELLTPPLSSKDGGPRFSLCLKLRVSTIPFQPQPLLLVRLSKRRFLSKLPTGWTRNGRITGHIWSAGHRKRVFTFDVNRRARGAWETDALLEACIQRLGLNAHAWDAESIVAGLATTPEAEVRLVYSAGTAGGQRPKVLSGVPERDKLDLFANVQRLLAPLGVVPLPVPTSLGRTTGPAPAAHRRMNAETMLHAVAHHSEEGPQDGVAGEPKSALEDVDVEAVLRRRMSLAISDMHKIADDPAQWDPKLDLLAKLAERNADGVLVHRPSESPTLVLLHERGLPKGLARLASHCVRLLLGDSVAVHAQQMPADVAGPRADLPERGAAAQARFEARVQAWEPIATAIREAVDHPMCLVLSREWYGPRGKGRRHDDLVNKAAGRRSLAAVAGGNVQYLSPPDTVPGGDEVDIAQFFFRLQAALCDLVFAHAGRVDDLQERVRRHFPEDPPEEIIGFTVVRRNSFGRLFEKSFIAVAIKLEVNTGRAFLRFGHRGPNGRLHATTWQPFSRALSKVAQLTPAILGDDWREQKVNFQEFVAGTLDEAVEAETHPVVLIDSTNGARLWPWLADKQVDPSNIKIANRSLMQQDWKGMRFVRVREGSVPALPTDIEVALAESGVEDATAPAELARERVVRRPTSRSGLYRMTGEQEDGVGVYLSVASQPDTFREKRGVSCYRSVQVWNGLKPAQKNSAGLSLGRLAERAPVEARWSTPDPVELTLLMAGERDDPLDVVRLVHGLRRGFGHFGGWAKLPAPLFFGRVVRDYVARFDIEEADAVDDGA